MSTDSSPAKDASVQVPRHRHTWIEGPNGHLICESCGSAYSPVNDLAAARDEVADLRKALADAVEGMEDMIAYVPDYFVQKWQHDAYIDRARRALQKSD